MFTVFPRVAISPKLATGGSTTYSDHQLSAACRGDDTSKVYFGGPGDSGTVTIRYIPLK